MNTMMIILFLIILVILVVVAFIVMRFFKMNNKLKSSIVDLEQVALSGNAEAMFKVGHIYYAGEYGIQPDIIKAVEYFKLASDKDIELANFILSGIYLEGKGGIPKDIKLGFHYLKLSADLGNKVASRMIGLEYSKDNGIFGKDINQSARYFFKAAEKGDVMSQKVVAGIYRFTAGLDKKISYAWYKVAGSSGDKISDEDAIALYNEFTDNERLEADKLAEEYLRKVEKNMQ